MVKFWKTIGIGGLCLATGAVSSLATNYLSRKESNKLDLTNMRIKRTSYVKIKNKRKQIVDYNKLPCKTFNFKKGSYKTRTQDNNLEDITDFIKRSKDDDDLSNYVKFFFKKLKKEVYTANQNIYPKQLAKKLVYMAWKSLAKNADYNLDYESEGDSRQTWKEFMIPKDKTKKPMGDCDDFTGAFLSIYEKMRELAELNRKNDVFYEKLFQGLLRTQIAGVRVSGKSYDHELIMMINYSSGFRYVIAKPLEPQMYKELGDSSYFFGITKNRLLLWDSREINVKIRDVKKIFNSQTVCVPK